MLGHYLASHILSEILGFENISELRSSPSHRAYRQFDRQILPKDCFWFCDITPSGWL
jgi:hypothetical protein